MNTSMHHGGGGKALAVMAAASFVIMYALMYMMVDRYGNVHANINQFYMAAAMTAAMVLVEIAVMGSMYGKAVKVAAAVSGVVGLVAFVFLLRGQIAVSDREFLRSMIPHHGAALLMCEKADLEDAEIKELCRNIVASQQAEIDWMQAKLSSIR